MRQDGVGNLRAGNVVAKNEIPIWNCREIFQRYLRAVIIRTLNIHVMRFRS